MVCWRSGTAQVTKDWQVQSVTTVLADHFLGWGVGYAVRPPGRLRFGGALNAGSLEGALGGRAEAFLAFHVNPGRENGFGPYAAAGLAANINRAGARGYLEVLLGLEQHPGRRTGWFLEAGVGGGLRLAAGYRLRSGSGIRR